MPRRRTHLWAAITVATIAWPLVLSSQQRNIAFGGVPDFLKHNWEIVLGPSSGGDIADMVGEILTGNQILMVSTEAIRRVAADFAELNIDSTIQYNLRDTASASDYNTLFHLKARNGDAILYPGANFWTISVRFANVGPYTSYVAVLAGHRRSLEEVGLWTHSLQSQRRLLARRYGSLAKGLDP